MWAPPSELSFQKPSNMGRILAFDTGIKRTGIACTDPENRIARAVETIETAKTEGWLKNYILKEEVSAFVVGHPTRLNEDDTHGTSIAKQFAMALKGLYPNIPVYLIDERLSSVQAAATLIDSGLSKSRRKDKKL